MSQTIVDVVSPAPRDLWSQVLEADKDALITQSPAWMDAMCEVSGFNDASRYYKMQDGNQIIMPMVRKISHPSLLTTQASYSEGWGMGGLVSTNPLTSEHIRAVFEDLAHLHILQTTIRPNPLQGELWANAVPEYAITIPRRAHVLELSDDFETYWKSLSSSTRNKVRKAEKAGIVIECDTTGRLVPVFYDLLNLSFERWGNQQHEPAFLARWRGQHRDSLHKFEVLAKLLGESFRVWVAWLDGKAVASIIVLQGKNAHYTRGAMNKDLVGNSHANFLLQKCAIEEAIQRGSQYYHMGESGNSESLSLFKSHFGAEPYDYAEYHLEKLPLTKINKGIRTVVKQVIGFKD